MDVILYFEPSFVKRELENKGKVLALYTSSQ